MTRKLHEIGFVLGFTKAQIIEIDEKRIDNRLSERDKRYTRRGLYKPRVSGHKRTIKVRYLEDSQTNKKGTEMWISPCTLSKQRRWNYTPKED